MNIADQPHVVAFALAKGDKRELSACLAYGNYGAIHERFAVYPNRALADAAQPIWSGTKDKADTYFVVPAEALGLWDRTDGPLTAEQRGALFATFGEVFGHTDSEPRYAFTRMALGKGPTDTVSWSRHKDGALTYGEASKVLDALDLLNV